MTAQADTQLVYLQPHMHLRGKDYEVRLAYPNGKTETIFKAKWDFNWQLGYDLVKPIPIPKGTRIIGIAHYDNSANNKFNPDPGKTGRLGQSELGRDAELLHGVPCGPRRAESQDIVQSVGRESVAARNIWPNACRNAVVLDDCNQSAGTIRNSVAKYLHL